MLKSRTTPNHYLHPVRHGATEVVHNHIIYAVTGSLICQPFIRDVARPPRLRVCTPRYQCQGCVVPDIKVQVSAGPTPTIIPTQLHPNLVAGFQVHAVAIIGATKDYKPNTVCARTDSEPGIHCTIACRIDPNGSTVHRPVHRFQGAMAVWGCTIAWPVEWMAFGADDDRYPLRDHPVNRIVGICC